MKRLLLIAVALSVLAGCAGREVQVCWKDSGDYFCISAGQDETPDVPRRD